MNLSTDVGTSQEGDCTLIFYPFWTPQETRGKDRMIKLVLNSLVRKCYFRSDAIELSDLIVCFILL
jgi:hypothetical protein